ncbi:hypothetical protein L3Q82_001373 [Scortum barcoo]|uniref:Uncharacterized protein n=1 Tax=Scortum barcoo TaxID=214431 RepID=A0ACB8W7R1_9TELE|nr:hypothetical protein L3Q82_001373 [Scortum barcoo]
MRLWWRLWSPMQWSAGEGGVLSGIRRGFNRLIKRASSVCGCPLDSIEVMGERRALAKLSTIMDNTSHPLHQTVGALSSSFSNRLRHPRALASRWQAELPVAHYGKPHRRRAVTADSLCTLSGERGLGSYGLSRSSTKTEMSIDKKSLFLCPTSRLATIFACLSSSSSPMAT